MVGPFENRRFGVFYDSFSEKVSEYPLRQIGQSAKIHNRRTKIEGNVEKKKMRVMDVFSRYTAFPVNIYSDELFSFLPPIQTLTSWIRYCKYTWSNSSSFLSYPLWKEEVLLRFFPEYLPRGMDCPHDISLFCTFLTTRNIKSALNILYIPILDYSMYTLSLHNTIYWGGLGA